MNHKLHSNAHNMLKMSVAFIFKNYKITLSTILLFMFVLPNAKAYRYLRINVTQGRNFKITELDWRVNTTNYPTANLTSNTSNGVVVSGTGGANSYRVFDGNATTLVYFGDVSSAMALTIDLGSSVNINPTSVVISSPAFATLSGFNCQGSNDGTTWTTILTRTGGVWLGTNEFPISTTSPPSSGGRAAFLGTNFWWVGNGFGEQPFAAGINFATTTNPWSSTFLGDLGIYKTFRFAVWGGVKNSSLKNWNDRRQKTDPSQTANTNTDGTCMPCQIAYEWLIDLCNRQNADLWLPIPHQVVNRNGVQTDFVKKLAILIKTGVDMKNVNLSTLGNLSTKTQQDFINAGGVKTCEPLKSTLRWYIEYSNETWNSIFLQSWWCNTEGDAKGFAPTPTGTKPDGTPRGPRDNWAAGYSFHAWAAIKIFDEAETVFGETSTRLGRVCAGWSGHITSAQRHMDIFNSSTHNPGNERPDFYAIAPYYGNGIDGAASNVGSLVTNNITSQVDEVIAQKAVITPNNIKMIAYEGGQHLLTNSDVYCRNSIIYNHYIDYFNRMEPHFELFCHFANVGEFSSQNSWGAKEFHGQPAAQAHKWRALNAWVSAGAREEASGNDFEILENNSNTQSPVFPNPAKEAVQVRAIPGTVISILGTDGKVYLQTLASESLTTVSLTNLSPGIYILFAGELKTKLIIE